MIGPASARSWPPAVSRYSAPTGKPCRLLARASSTDVEYRFTVVFRSASTSRSADCASAASVIERLTWSMASS
jgi:hypothetical protein